MSIYCRSAYYRNVAVNLTEAVRTAAQEELQISGSFRGVPLQHHHLVTVRRLASSPSEPTDLRPLVRRLLACVLQDWILGGQDDRGSEQNWALRVRDPVGEGNERLEEILNRSIATAAPQGWFNEVAVSSGIGGEGAMHVDLVHEVEPERRYELIELKWKSNTPLYAATQVVLYGAYYLFSRMHAARFGYGDPPRPLLHATEVDLRVLAPAAYYSEIDGSAWFTAFEGRLSGAVACVGRETLGPGFSMSFAFEKLPEDFIDPEAPADAIRSAVEDRRAVFPR